MQPPFVILFTWFLGRPFKPGVDYDSFASPRPFPFVVVQGSNMEIHVHHSHTWHASLSCNAPERGKAAAAWLAGPVLLLQLDKLVATAHARIRFEQIILHGNCRFMSAVGKIHTPTYNASFHCPCNPGYWTLASPMLISFQCLHTSETYM